MSEKKENFLEFFLKAVNAVGGPAQAAKLSGKSTRQIQRYCQGEQEPPFSAVDSIANAAHMPLNLFSLEATYLSPSLNEDFVSVPVINVQASAGHGVLVENEKETDFMRFNREWLRKTYYVNPSEVFILPVEGESMEPTIRSGELILIKKVDNAVKPGDGIYVVRLEGTVLVKRLQFLPQRKIKVSSDNLFYDPYELQIDDGTDFAILGRVLSCLRAL